MAPVAARKDFRVWIGIEIDMEKFACNKTLTLNSAQTKKSMLSRDLLYSREHMHSELFPEASMKLGGTLLHPIQQQK